MHKLIIPLVFFLGTQISFAQFSLGVEAGANFSTVQFTNLDGADPAFLVGANVGIAPRYSFGEKISVLTEVQYSTKGHKISNATGGSEVKNKYTYITIAPQFEYLIGNVVGLSGGPFLGIKTYEGTKYPDQDWINTTDLDLIASSDFGFIVAARVFLNRFYLKAAYEHGLADIGNVIYTDINGQTIDNNAHTRNIQVGLGYLIGFDN